MPNGVAATLSYVSKDGDQNFPGTLTTHVTYTLTNDNALRIDYQASTDKHTVINFTNHSYFNLAGNGSGSVADQMLLVNADRYTPTGPDLIPTGEIAPVEGTPLDFRQMMPIGARLNSAFQQMVNARGYDHNFVLNQRPGDSITFAARAYDPRTGRVIDCFTTEPGLQVYTSNGLNGSVVGSSGTTYRQTEAFTLETQHFPDSPNKPNFPTTELKPGQEFRSTTIYPLRDGCPPAATAALRRQPHSCRLAKRRALRQRLELRPGDLRMNAPAEPAVGRSDDPLPADEVGEAQDALGDQLRMLDHVGGVADDARQHQLVVGQLHLLPDLPLVLVADIAGLERVGVGVDRQHDLDDVPHRDVGRVRAVPASPAQVEPDAVLRQAPDRVVERLDPDHRELPVVLHRRLGIDHVPVLGDRRIVELQDKPRLDDRLVFLAHRIGAGVQQFLLGLVVGIADARGAARGDRAHEALLDAGRLHRRLEVGDVGRIASWPV